MGQKKFKSEKFRSERNFGSKKIEGPKKFELKKLFSVQKYFGSEKNLGLKYTLIFIDCINFPLLLRYRDFKASASPPLHKKIYMDNP